MNYKSLSLSEPRLADSQIKFRTTRLPQLLGANHGKAEGTTAFHFHGLMRDPRIHGRALCGAELHRIMGQTR
jgi:hypothetical protein